MDEPHFLQSGQIIENPQAVEYYLHTDNASTLEDVAASWVDAFVKIHDGSDQRRFLEAVEIGLIKMVLIHKIEMPKSSAAKKQAEFMRFLKRDLGLLLGREAHLALHYFRDRAGKLLGIQSNTPYEKARDGVRRTAWDLYLLRYAEGLFSNGVDKQCIAYVATMEKSLQALARLYTIERISSSPNDGIIPKVSYDTSSIPEDVLVELGPEDSYADFQYLMAKGRQKASIPVGLLSALERELARFCK